VANDSDSSPSWVNLVTVIAAPMLAILAAGGMVGYFGLLPNKLVGYAMLITVPSAGVGGLVLAVVWRKWPEFLPQGVMAAMGTRMMLTLVGILVFVLISGESGLKFVVYTVVFYIVGLICETVTAVRKLTTGASHASASHERET